MGEKSLGNHSENTRQKKQHKDAWTILLACFLFVCVMATTMIVADRMNGYLIDDSGAISLVPEFVEPETQGGQQATLPAGEAPETEGATESPDATEGTQEGTQAGTEGDSAGESGSQGGSQGTVQNAPAQSGQQSQPGRPVHPGFSASDDQTQWTTNTPVEIFRVSYENGENQVTMAGSDGAKIIAPGAKNSYTFKLKNTGDVALYYGVNVDIYFSHDGIDIPVKGRLCRYDGTWIAGDQDTYVDMAELEEVVDIFEVGVGHFVPYTLEWCWPFEGDDDFDTMLGNLAAKEDVVLTMVIWTNAWMHEDPESEGGIPGTSGGLGGLGGVDTGDHSTVILWLAMAIIFFILLIVMIILKIVDRKREGAEADESWEKDQKRNKNGQM